MLKMPILLKPHPLIKTILLTLFALAVFVITLPTQAELIPKAEITDELPFERPDHKTAQWVERYILKNHDYLLDNSENDHVLAFYFFGYYQSFTVFGMERIKGDDYKSYNTVLIFKDSKLQGYYEKLTVFPAGVSKAGEVFFPANYQSTHNINLALGDYPAIQFIPELDRYKKGDLKTMPPSFSYKPLK